MTEVPSVNIRPLADEDWPAVWALLHATFQAGDTYAFAPESSEAAIRRAWTEPPASAFVACSPAGAVLGTYFIKPNQPGLGAHVCNCGYVVAPAAQGQGVASAMCAHSQDQALVMGYRAMQFNLVVATNERAVRLWHRLGFAVVGRLPGAFRHARLGFVDALIMFKVLGSEAATPAPARAGALIYAQDLARLSAFYRRVLGLSQRHADAGHHVLESADCQIVIHAIPASIAATLTIQSPPEPREEATIKLFFTVPSLAAAQAEAQALGGDVFDAAWAGPGFVVRNAYDPEGNIFQIRESTT